MTSDSFFKVLGFLIKVVLGLCGGFVALVVLSFFTNPRGYKSKAYGQFTACKSNCKNIATALEMYASDHKGRGGRDLPEDPPHLSGGGTHDLRKLPGEHQAGRF